AKFKKVLERMKSVCPYSFRLAVRLPGPISGQAIRSDRIAYSKYDPARPWRTPLELPASARREVPGAAAGSRPAYPVKTVKCGVQATISERTARGPATSEKVRGYAPNQSTRYAILCPVHWLQYCHRQSSHCASCPRDPGASGKAAPIPR